MKRGEKFRRGLGGAVLAGAVLAGVWITAGNAGDIGTLRELLPMAALQWQAGERLRLDDLSPAAVLTISQSPALLSARGEVACALLRGAEEETKKDAPPQKADPAPTEEPVPVPAAGTDNGVTAKTLVPTSGEGYTVCGLAYISNSTSYELDAASLEQQFAAELTEGGPQVLILHSHGSEGYTPAEDAAVVWSGEHRTTDSRYNVVHAGDVLAETLAAAGISVLHDRTLYDYPNYTGAYDRSLEAAEAYLARYPSIRFVLDVHRDAIEDGSGGQYKVVADTPAGTAAQMTLVVGSDGSGLPHSGWLENLRLAVALQQDILGTYPTLMRPVLFRNSRYNQHVAPGALLVEMGAAGNSPEEAALAARLLGEKLAELLEGRSK